MTIESDGVVASTARPRGNHSALEFIVNFVRDRVVGSDELHLAVMQADNETEAAHLLALAEDELHPSDIFMTDFTPVMGAHTGPGVVGLAYYAPILERPGTGEIQRDKAQKLYWKEEPKWKSFPTFITSPA